MDEVTKLKNRGKLEKLAPGSWIHGNFDTWSGHPEKNRAWELIYQTKRDYEHHLNAVTSETEEKITFHFLAAECSDWFWWYGDDHVTEFSLEFDKLFREHLISIYTLLNIHPPADLFEPIISHKSSASFLLKPQTAITPQLNGKNNSFFDWLGSGSIDESKLYSTMDRVRGPIEIIYYGQDEKNVYLAFEGDIELLKKSDLQFQVIIEETNKSITLDMKKLSAEDGVALIIGERIELAISKWHFKDYSTIHLRFEILNKQEIIQTMPGYGALAIDLQETYDSNWFV
jgi:alpha-amylase/alpha-mannosidase (GH57 family)